MSNFKYRKYSLKSSNYPKLQKINPYKFYIVYKTINLLNLKEYIGTHCSNYLMDDYMGSGVELKRDMDEFGIENFKRINIRVFYNHHDMVKCERRLVDSSYLSRPDTYNIAKGGVNSSCSDIDLDYLDGLREMYIDYGIEDYGKLIDHLCVLRNELIYKPDIKNRVSFKKAAESYYKLNKKFLNVIKSDEINEELESLRKSHHLLDEMIDLIGIDKIKKAGYNVTHLKTKLNEVKTINLIKESIISKYKINVGDILDKNEILEIVNRIISDYDLSVIPTVSFLDNFFVMKRKTIKGKSYLMVGDKK